MEMIRQIGDSFHALHEQTYTFRLNSPLELVNYQLTAVGVVRKVEISPVSTAGLSLARARKEARQVIFDGFGALNTTVYERDLLPINKPMQGPCLIEEPASVTVVYPDQQVYRDKFGFLHIELGKGKTRA
jgi:N-methylhydantoinase A